MKLPSVELRLASQALHNATYALTRAQKLHARAAERWQAAAQAYDDWKAVQGKK